jgi:crotonobetainyl-CoA:carnitine CoA-transferase CaiB-like acyl-CoA transferase
VALNAGKRSLAMDIRTAARRASWCADLAATADVFIENFRPGVVAKYGLDYEVHQSRQARHRLLLDLGLWPAGEWAGRGAYDHVVQALTGMMMMSGERRTTRRSRSAFRSSTWRSGMLGALSVSAALHRRDRDGPGPVHRRLDGAGLADADVPQRQQLPDQWHRAAARGQPRLHRQPHGRHLPLR